MRFARIVPATGEMEQRRQARFQPNTNALDFIGDIAAMGGDRPPMIGGQGFVILGFVGIRLFWDSAMR